MKKVVTFIFIIAIIACLFSSCGKKCNGDVDSSETDNNGFRINTSDAAPSDVLQLYP